MGLLHFSIQRASLPELIEAAQYTDLDDSRAMNEIVRRFEPMTRRLSRTMATCPYLQEDLANAARYGLVRAVRRHDHRAAGFSAYAERFMKGAAFRERQRQQVTAAVDIDAVHLQLADPADAESAMLDQLSPWGDGPISDAIGGLSTEQQELVAQRYLEDGQLEEIAAASGTTVSAVSQRLATVHRRLLRSMVDRRTSPATSRMAYRDCSNTQSLLID